MMKQLRHVLLLSAAFLLFLTSCGKEKGKVIPRGKLAEIYAEMLVADQWIVSTAALRREADTSLVYAPILEKYGYTPEDYRASLSHYMKDPERYSRILRTTSEILDERLKVLKNEQSRLARIAEIKVFVSDFDPKDYAPYLGDCLVMYHDSLSFESDSATVTYRLMTHETSDTTFDGPVIVVRLDSLSDVSDSTFVEDSLLQIADSLAIKDSIKTMSKLSVKEFRSAEDSLLTKTKKMSKKHVKGVNISKLDVKPEMIINKKQTDER